jgi:hypothetical protein
MANRSPGNIPRLAGKVKLDQPNPRQGSAGRDGYPKRVGTLPTRCFVCSFERPTGSGGVTTLLIVDHGLDVALDDECTP